MGLVKKFKTHEKPGKISGLFAFDDER